MDINAISKLSQVRHSACKLPVSLTVLTEDWAKTQSVLYEFSRRGADGLDGHPGPFVCTLGKTQNSSRRVNVVRGVTMGLTVSAMVTTVAVCHLTKMDNTHKNRWWYRWSR